MEIGQQYQLEITTYTHEGFGLGHIDGFVLMVPGAIVGECCLVQVSKVHATYALHRNIMKMARAKGDERLR